MFNSIFNFNPEHSTNEFSTEKNFYESNLPDIKKGQRGEGVLLLNIKKTNQIIKRQDNNREDLELGQKYFSNLSQKSADGNHVKSYTYFYLSMLICITESEWKDYDETPVLYFILHLGSLAKSHRDFTVSDQSKHHKERKNQS